MVIWDNKWFKLKISKAGKGEPFHWKAAIVPHLKSMAQLKYTGNQICSDLYVAENSFIIHFLQIFWLWFVVSLELKEEKLSDIKMVKYEATHYVMLDEQLS